MSDEEHQLKAGHPPAVKAGGMRIVQHKTPNTERPGKDPVEVIGLNNPPPNIQTEVVGANKETKVDKLHEHSAAQVHKPPHNVPKAQLHNIQQPKK